MKTPASAASNPAGNGFFRKLFLDRLHAGVENSERHPANEWLRVSPSVTYFDYGSGADFSDLPKVALGLDFNLASSSEGWSLSTGFQYPLSRYASTRLSDTDTADSHIIDMSLTFRQWLTDHVQFSVTGERFYKYSYGPKGSPSALDMDDHQVSFALHFFY